MSGSSSDPVDPPASVADRLSSSCSSSSSSSSSEASPSALKCQIWPFGYRLSKLLRIFSEIFACSIADWTRDSMSAEYAEPRMTLSGGAKSRGFFAKVVSSSWWWLVGPCFMLLLVFFMLLSDPRETSVSLSVWERV